MNSNKETTSHSAEPGPQSRICYGMVGLGGFGRRRREQLRESECFRLKGGVDVRAEVFSEVAAQEGHAVISYSSLEEMVADPEIELVVVSTPASLHVEQAMVAARAGKAVFTEKPLGHDLAACRELVELCEKEGIPHGHGFASRFDPLWQFVRRQIFEEKLLGRVVGVSFASMHTGGLFSAAENWRFDRKRNPGGPLYQCGIHKLHLLQLLFGPGEWLHGMGLEGISGSEAMDGLVLSGRFGGIPVTFHSYYVACYWHNYEFYGTEGNFIVDEHPNRLLYKKTDPTSGFEPVEDWTDRIPREPEGGLSQMRDLALAVRESRQPLINGRHGLEAIESIYQALALTQTL